MNILTLTDAQWDNALHTSFTCKASFEGLDGTHPYSAVNGTGDDIVQAVWDEGTKGAIAEWSATPQNVASLRAQIDQLLSKSDVVVLRAFEDGTATPDVWKTYRSTLRTLRATGSGAIPPEPTTY